MTFIHELELYSLKMSPQTKNELSTPRLLKVIILHTDSQSCTQPAKLLACRFVSGNNEKQQDAQLSQRDRAAGCVTVFAKSRTLELGDNDLRTL